MSGVWTPGPWRRQTPHRRCEMANIFGKNGEFIGSFARREDADFAVIAPEMAELLAIWEDPAEIGAAAMCDLRDRTRALLAKVNGESDE